MEWFGWLTKGRANVSALDICILIVEMGAFLTTILLGALLYDWTVSLFSKKPTALRRGSREGQ